LSLDYTKLILDYKGGRIIFATASRHSRHFYLYENCFLAQCEKSDSPTTTDECKAIKHLRAEWITDSLDARECRTVAGEPIVDTILWPVVKRHTLMLVHSHV